MDAPFHTPLLDLFRRGEVERDVRLLAAQGALAPRAHEQLGLLMLLAMDSDPEVRAAAEGTFASIPAGSLESFIARSDVSNDTRAFFAARGILPAPHAAADADAPLVTGSTTADVSAAADGRSAVQRIAAMTIAQRVTLAMRGSREERALLIRDANKVVAMSVLSAPQVSDSEVESFARMANVTDDVLRAIAGTRAWMKNYAVCVALTRNAKTPPAISMNLIARLADRDLKRLSIDRNVPEVVRITARKKLAFEGR
jgi:hypothetical protein